MESVYLETTVISYLTSRPSRDLLVAAHQQITNEWWTNRQTQFRCFISQVVMDEVSVGDANESQKRLSAIHQFPVLPATLEAEKMTQAIMTSGVMPVNALRDAAHISIATFHEIDYFADVELQAPGKCANFAENSIHLSPIGLPYPCRMHARRINGELTCGKTRLLPKFTGCAMSWPLGSIMTSMKSLRISGNGKWHWEIGLYQE